MANRYARTKLKNRPIDMHRKVMQLALGRELRTDEYVHHINGNKRDNRLENLEVIDPHSHAIHHLQKHPTTKKCVICGAEFAPEKTKRARQMNCGSDECKAAYKRLKVHNRKLNDADLKAIRERRAAGDKLNAIAADYGVTFGTISAVTTGYRQYGLR